MIVKIYIYIYIYVNIYIYIYIYSCELNYHDQKIRRTPTHDIREHWTPVSTWLGLISSVYRNLPHWRSNQWPQIAVADFLVVVIQFIIVIPLFKRIEICIYILIIILSISAGSFWIKEKKLAQFQDLLFKTVKVGCIACLPACSFPTKKGIMTKLWNFWNYDSSLNACFLWSPYLNSTFYYIPSLKYRKIYFCTIYNKRP